MVSQLFPGPTADRSRTVQTIITRSSAGDRRGPGQKAQTYTDFLYEVVRDEDYKTGLDIQKGLDRRRQHALHLRPQRAHACSASTAGSTGLLAEADAER